MNGLFRTLIHHHNLGGTKTLLLLHVFGHQRVPTPKLAHGTIDLLKLVPVCHGFDRGNVTGFQSEDD